jgi:PAS domain S-box-containing protein
MTRKSPLRVLLLEDDPTDAELVRAVLEADRFVCEATRVQTSSDFIEVLESVEFDLILADYQLPSFDGVAALKLALAARPDLPFIFVSGTLGEEVAIEALKLGATDYVLKSGLSRLVPSVERALREARERSQRKRAEETLREQANLLDLTHDALFVHDMKGVITYWNRGAEALYGWTAGEARGKVAAELLQTAFPSPFELKDGRWQGELVRTTKGGAQVVIASRWSLQRDAKRAPIAILETNNDITERKRAEEALQRSEKELRDLIEALPTMAFSVAPDGTTVWVNRHWVEYSGLSVEQTSAPGWHAIIHPEDRERHVSRWLQSMADNEPYESEARHRNVHGEYRSLLVRAVPLRDEQGRLVKWYGTLTDIEDRRRVEQALARSEAYLAEAQRLTHTGSFAFKVHQDAAVYWSDENYRIWGLDSRQGPPDRKTLARLVHPEDRDRFIAGPDRARHEGGDYTFEFRVVRPDGAIRHLRGLAHPVFSASGELVEFVGTNVDVTELKRAEEEHEKLRQLEADLAHIDRVTMMGELAASLAHEIKQPMTAALANADACVRWLRRERPDTTEACAAASAMVGDVKRAAGIIDRVRSLYRRGRVEPELIDVNDVIREMTVLLREAAIRNAISISTELDLELPTTTADRVQLQQVLMNLMLNGIEAMSENGGELTVTSARAGDGQLLISVRDAGVGLPLDDSKRIFEAFFTTKPQGSGMGLSISRRIIESHGGHLSASANLPRGAIFQFTLPINPGVAS